MYTRNHISASLTEQLIPLVIAIVVVLSGCNMREESKIKRGHQFSIVDGEKGRQLLVDGQVSDYVDTLNWTSFLKYPAVMDLPAHFFVKPGRMLLVGLGGGSILHNYRRMQWDVSVIEPDSQRIRIVQNLFGVRDLDKIVTLGDGRSVLAGVSQTYDIILIDYISANYPDSLLTREFFAMASSRLAEGGILGIVIESLGWKDESVKAVARTLSTSFLQVTVLPIVEPPDRFCPIVLMASNTARNSLLRDPDRNYELDPDWRYGPEYQKLHAWDNHFTIEDSGIPIQTDRENSLERVFTRIRKFRKQQPPGYLP